MNKKMLCAAAAIAAAFAVAGCGQTRGDGGINMNTGVAGLMDDQHFCFTWELYQEAPGGWTLVDALTAPICAEDGVDSLHSYASCYDGRRFLVVYEVTLYDETGQLGSAAAVSGGGEEDVCVKNTDVDTSVLFQFRNEGIAGGVNPQVSIDQVCSNDKAVLENGRAVSAVWVQPDECGAGDPDSYCVLGTGCGLETVRVGTTADGRTRFVYSESDPTAAWSLYYLFFEPVVPMDTLVLQHSPYVLHHELGSAGITRDEPNATVVFRYDSPVQGINVGIISLVGEQLDVLFDLGDCNGPADALEASHQTLAVPACSGTASLLGAVPAGGSAFKVVLQCSGGGLQFIDCNALGDWGGGICEQDLTGAWSIFRPVDPESQAVFDQAMQGWTGASFTPREVSMQVVAGINYRFRADGWSVTPDPQEFKALVDIFQPLQGDPTVTNITTWDAASCPAP